MSRMHGSFFAVAAAVTASLYDACGNDWSWILYSLWLALKSATTFLLIASSTLLPPLCVHRVSVVTPFSVEAPLVVLLDEHPASPTAVTARTATAAAAERCGDRRGFEGPEGMACPLVVWHSGSRGAPAGSRGMWLVSAVGLLLGVPVSGVRRFGDRLAGHQRAGQLHLLRRRVWRFDLADKRFERPGTHLVVREGDGGEPGSQALGDQILVVETDHRQVLGDAQAAFRRGVVDPHGHPVVEAEDRGRSRIQVEYRAGRVVAAFGIAETADDEGVVVLDAGGLEGLAVAVEASPRCGNVVDVVQESNAPVPGADQHFDRGPRAALFVRHR